MTIQAVLFDMGGTIETFWYDRELRLKATPGFRQRLQKAGVDLGISDEQLLELITAGMGRYNRWRLANLTELPSQRILGEFVLAGIPFDPASLAPMAEDLMFYYETQFYLREMRPEVPGVLEAIRQMGLKIGLISNVCSRGQAPHNLEAYGIRDYFDPVVLSSEYGRRKPDPAIFHYAARLAATPTSQCAYIGDTISRDVSGARRAGYRLAIQIRHDFSRDEEDLGIAPNVFIENMTGLLPILQAELRRSASKPLPKSAAPPQLRAVLFDAGDILYYRPRRYQKLSAFLKELGLIANKADLEDTGPLTDKAYTGQISRDEYQETILRLLGVTQPEQIQRGKQIIDEEDEDNCFFPGVRDTLLALKNMGYLLGIVTDTAQPISRKLDWFEHAGFGSVWDTIISSQELGVRKPDPRIYQAALNQLSLQPEEAIFVGHKAYELDGARRVGMKTVAFNYEPAAQADCYIESFSDLLKIPLISAINTEQVHY